MVDQSRVDETECYNTSHHSNHYPIYVYVHKMACVYITVVFTCKCMCINDTNHYGDQSDHIT